MNDTNKLSRRRFLGMSGMAGLGMVLSSNPIAANVLDITAYTGKKFKMGIIGCGNRSKAIIGALNRIPEIEITALCDTVPHKMAQRAQLVKSSVKPKYIDNVKELLQLDLDVTNRGGTNLQEAIVYVGLNNPNIGTNFSTKSVKRGLKNGDSGVQFENEVTGLKSGTYYVRVAARAQNPNNRYNMTKVMKVEL